MNYILDISLAGLYFGFLNILFKKLVNRLIRHSMQLPLTMGLEGTVMLPMASIWGTGRALALYYDLVFLVIHQLH